MASSIFEKKINSHPYTIPKWEDWSEEDRRALVKNCGETMQALGYDPDTAP